MFKVIDHLVGLHARPTNSSPRWLIASVVLPCIIIMAVGLRLGSAAYLADVVTALPGIHDQISYDTLARRVITGNGFTFPSDWWPATRAGEPTAHWSYLYTLYLSAVYALFGSHAVVARLIQAIVAGVLQPWLTYRIGARIFGPAVGLVAAGIAAFYSYFVYYAGALMTETFYILAILWTLDLAMGMVKMRSAESSRNRIIDDSTKSWLKLGLALGIAVLLRQVFLLFVPFLFAWLVWARYWPCRDAAKSARDCGWRSSVAGLLIATAVLFALIAPWTVHNYQAFGRFVLLNTNAGYAFFWANHPIQGTDFKPLLPEAVYQDIIPSELRGLDEATLEQALLWEGLRLVAEDPRRYAQLSLSRIGVYFQFWPTTDSGSISNLGRVLSFGVTLPLMLYGLINPIVRRRRYVLMHQEQAIVLLYLFAGAYTLIHILSWALIRYRLPVDAILILFAALAVTDLLARLMGGSFWRLRPGEGPPS